MVPWGWRAAMVASAIPALVIAVIWLLVRESAPAATTSSPRAAAGGTGRESHGRVVVRLLKAPGFALLTLSYTLQGYVGYIFIFWFYLYLVQVRHFSLVEGAFISSLPWVLSAVSIPPQRNRPIGWCKASWAGVGTSSAFLSWVWAAPACSSPSAPTRRRPGWPRWRWPSPRPWSCV